MLRCLDLFCGAGGAGEGYRRAGFDVTGAELSQAIPPAYTEWLGNQAMKVLHSKPA